MPRIDSDTLYGTLSLLILQTLAGNEALHGLEIQRRIHAATGEVLQIEEGALYPALHRLERDELLTAVWGTSTKKRRAKFYSLTPKGARQLEQAKAGWLAHVRAVLRVLDESVVEGSAG